jgi:hypothetical protein
VSLSWSSWSSFSSTTFVPVTATLPSCELLLLFFLLLLLLVVLLLFSSSAVTSSSSSWLWSSMSSLSAPMSLSSTSSM